jgi:predicted ATP-grasp superfamily ATP-dependent carboligase
MTHQSKVLIFATRDWFGPARLPSALVRAGFSVVSLSFAEALITHSRHVETRLLLPDAPSDTDFITALRRALLSVEPDLVVPGDDPAVELLHALYFDAKANGPASLTACLQRSLGDSAHYPQVQSRQGLHAQAVELGLRLPEQEVVTSLDEAKGFADRHGFPLVLKVENSSAGFGTYICKDVAALAAGFAYFDARFGRRGQTPSVMLAQRFITGQVAMRAVVALAGRVLAGLSALKVETHPAPTGPSTIVEFIENHEMARSAEELTRAFGIAGFASFDFMLEEGTGAAYLIELNPRPTPIVHLGGAFGPDLAGALWQALTRTPPRASQAVDARRRVALFPQEWVRQKDSAYFEKAFHDVPWDDPGLVSALVLQAREQMGWAQLSREEIRRERVRVLAER